MTPAIALLASPFLGPAVWAPVAELLATRGLHVITPAQSDPPPRTSGEVLRGLLRALPADEEFVLVPHSNAGRYVPAVVTRRRVRGFVFVDALLPASTGQIEMAPAELLDALRAKADSDGLLPPWTSWWEESEVAGLFPDRAVRKRVEQEQQRIPLSYFEGSTAVPAGWDQRPGAYLAFGDTYASERAAALARGWPVRTLDGAHLHMLCDPCRVADELLG